MHYTVGELYNYTKIKKSGKKTFYASEFGFNGGEITALDRRGMIKETGNCVIMPVKTIDGRTIMSKIKEWEFIDIFTHYNTWVATHNWKHYKQDIETIFKLAKLLEAE